MFPCLIPEWALNATVKVLISDEGVSEDGELIPQFELETKCNLQLKNEQKLDSKKQSVSLSGTAYFIGDIAPDIRTIKGGSLIHNEVSDSIHAGSKGLNFDGTVNYTVLELI